MWGVMWFWIRWESTASSVVCLDVNGFCLQELGTRWIIEIETREKKRKNVKEIEFK